MTRQTAACLCRCGGAGAPTGLRHARAGATVIGYNDRVHRSIFKGSSAMTTRHRYIVQNDAILSGGPIIEGTRTSVRAIVEIWRLGIAPEDIPNRLPHLTLAQVFDALSYYSDHQD